ncbi:lipoprotein [Spiroplasma citri]|uniref:lipoprotein n=1 Tax=Spiroplasma citri TaxID=2133 RepID=UPI00241273DF|nr:lipoprotein [Spiroplasma citri]WFH00266.1 lipoprotein [Spiroplasma citri]
MKKWLSIIGTIGLTTTSTTTLISCKKENNKNTKTIAIAPTTKAQQPPEGSNWKLITDYNSFENNVDNRYYFVIKKIKKIS